MTSGPVYLDGMLLDWDASLFFSTPPKKPASAKKGLTGLSLPKRKPNTGGGTVSKGGVKAIKSKLGSIVRKTPEVMVKVSGGGKGMKHIKAHLDYISRNGKIELEDQDGERIAGREGLLDLRDELQNGGFQVPDESEKMEAFNIILSMPAGTDELGLTRAARDFAGREFEGHQYVMALHTPTTDPDREPPKHPHVHLCVKARSFDGTRLHPRKADLQRWREGFAEALRENGIEASATKRVQRLQRNRGEKKSVKEMKKRGVALRQIGKSKVSAKRAQDARKVEAVILGKYKELAKALESSKDEDDKKLAKDVSAHLNRNLPHLTEMPKDRGADRGKEID